MKKRSIAGRLGVLALALTLVTTSLSSGTLAKYTASGTYTGVLKVAQWNPDMGTMKADGTVLCSDGLEFDLSDTFSIDGTGKIKAKEIAPGTEGYFAVMVDSAKGTGVGEVQSGVAIDYRVTIEGSTGNTQGFPPLLFMKQVPSDKVTKTGSNPYTIDPTTLGTLKNDATGAINVTEDPGELSKGILELGKTEAAAQKLIWIYWFWPYETKGENYSNLQAYQEATGTTPKKKGDAIDNEIGETGMTAKFVLNVEMVQHDPSQALLQNDGATPNTYWDYALDSNGDPKTGYVPNEQFDISAIYPNQTAPASGG